MMNILLLIEQLANMTHTSTDLIINTQSSEIQKAYRTNNPDILKKQFADKEHVAHSTRVVKL